MTIACRFLALFVLGALTAAADAPKAPVRNVVLVHGAWADGSSWAKVIPILEKAGLHVVAVQNPLTSLADDVATVQRAIALEDGRSCSSAIPTAAPSTPRPAPIRRSPGWFTSPRSRPMRARASSTSARTFRPRRLPEDDHEGHRGGFRAGPAESGPQDSRCEAKSHEWRGLRGQGHQCRTEVEADLVGGRRQRPDDPTGPRAAIREDDGSKEDHRRVQPLPMLSHANEVARLTIDGAKGVPID